MLNQAGKDYLATVDDHTLGYWWAYLNGGFIPNQSCEASDLWSVMGFIFDKVGHRKCLEAWHVRYQKNMTLDQFDNWYDNCGFGRD